MRAGHGPARAVLPGGAHLAIVLGSGMGGLSDGYRSGGVVSFQDIPGVGPTGVAGHRGSITQCRVGKRSCLFVEGRKHYYEGCGDEVHALVSFLSSVGVRELVVTAAAGSLVAGIQPGELVVIEDILDRQDRRPEATLVTDPTHGASRPSTRRLLELDRRLRLRLVQSACESGISLARGTLAVTSGPVYETHAEVRGLQFMGASVASMSVAPEVTSANAFGIQVACVAMVTNWATGISRTPLSHDDVLACGQRAMGGLRKLITQFITSS